jgi:hypothetical protein
MVANNYRLGKCRRYSVDTYYLPGQFDAQKIITGGKHLNQQLWDEVLAEAWTMTDEGNLLSLVWLAVMI